MMLDGLSQVLNFLGVIRGWNLFKDSMIFTEFLDLRRQAIVKMCSDTPRTKGMATFDDAKYGQKSLCQNFGTHVTGSCKSSLQIEQVPSRWNTPASFEGIVLVVKRRHEEILLLLPLQSDLPWLPFGLQVHWSPSKSYGLMLIKYIFATCFVETVSK